MKTHRQHLFKIYQAAIESVKGELCTFKALSNISLNEPVGVVAIGKAATSMMKGASAVLGDQLVDGLIITKTGHCEAIKKSAAIDSQLIQCIEASHPVPDEKCLSAGNQLLSFIDRQPSSRALIILISGGASSLVECLPEGVILEDIQNLNDWLLASGLDIHTTNILRSHFSSIKGGRLAKVLNGRKVLNLMISDVPDDKAHVIGSGLLLPNIDLQSSLIDPSSVELPDWLNERLTQISGENNPAPQASDACFNTIESHIIATIKEAKQAAASAAQSLGYEVCLHEEFIKGDAELVGRQLAYELIQSEPVLHIWGGETTVSLPETPGRGGRNQHKALAAAIVMEGRKDCCLLAGGTDGTDGPTIDAGAIVDGDTLTRGMVAGMDANKALAHADAGTFLAASGDLFRTGPTGTNVMDLIFGLKIRS